MDQFLISFQTPVVDDARYPVTDIDMLGETPKITSSMRKGLIWLQRDKLFSRWKERYVILTSDYLQCFKKASSRITEMGPFLFKVVRFIVH